MIELLTIRQAIDYFAAAGWKTSHGTISALTARGELNGRRLGNGRGRWFFTQADLDAYLLGGSQAAPVPVAQVEYRPQGHRHIRPPEARTKLRNVTPRTTRPSQRKPKT